MSFIRILRQWSRSLSPAFLALNPSADHAAFLSAGAELANAAHAVGHAWCWLDRNLGPASEATPRGSFVEAGESYYQASRERTIVQALYDGSLR